MHKQPLNRLYVQEDTGETNTAANLHTSGQMVYLDDSTQICIESADQMEWRDHKLMLVVGKS